MCLGKCRNARELQLITKQPHTVCHREEDAEAILDPTMHLLPDERSSLGCMTSHRAPWIWQSPVPGETTGFGVCGNFLLYILLYEGHGCMHNSLYQTSKCLPLIGGKEQLKGWRAKEPPRAFLGCSHQVIRWILRR